MKARLKVLSGHTAGAEYVFSKARVTIGRQAGSDVQCDPDKELDVSARHALLFKQGDHWWVRDLGSRNGTLVNGHRISADTRLDDTDQIRLGATGPAVEFRLVADSIPDASMPPHATANGAAMRPSVQSPAPAPEDAPPTLTGRGSTTQRIRVEVRRQTRHLRTLSGVLFGVLIVAVAAFAGVNYRQERVREREARLWQSRIDSVLSASDAAVQALKGQVAGLADALRRSQTAVERLNRELASARAAGNDQQVEALRARLSDAAQTLRNQQVAAQVDYPAIFETNQRAIAILYVEFGPGEVFTGTAFAVTGDGTMITNRHVVAGPDGTRRPTRMGVKFADSDQNFPARLLGISTDADLAAVKVDISGGTPTVRALEAGVTARPGDPVAIIGFPLGVDLPMSTRGGRAVARSTLTAGTVSKVLADVVQVDGYGAEGSSGSPIFDREGRVVGILYGGQPGTGGRIVFGVPVSYAVRLATRFTNPSRD